MILRFLFHEFEIQLIRIEVHIAPPRQGFQEGTHIVHAKR
jgi:hypothetical protein